MNPPFPHEVTPGWYGKLPGFGDFAGRRLDDAFVGDWDRWLQQGLTRLRQSGDYWLDNYLSSPVWRFALGAQVVKDLLAALDGNGGGAKAHVDGTVNKLIEFHNHGWLQS